MSRKRATNCAKRRMRLTYQRPGLSAKGLLDQNQLVKIKDMVKKLWVIKVGSQILIEQGPLFVRSLIEDVVSLQKKKNILIVTSGAIATARKRRVLDWKTLAQKQALSALGQPQVMELYNLALASQGLSGAQVLLTYQDFRSQIPRRNLKATLSQLLHWGAVPILNENDAVATEEIQFGDNDFLSALVASEMKAEKLIILTNVEGLYDRPPEAIGARVISRVGRVDKKILKLAGQKKSKLGRGGMLSKLWAAKKALSSGVEVHILPGHRPHVILEVIGKNPSGTWFSDKFINEKF